MSSNKIYIYIMLTSVYCAPIYMFRPIHMAIFWLLREEVFYYILKHLLMQKHEDGHGDWPKHVAWSTIITS
jgi:hypothetical protein